MFWFWCVFRDLSFGLISIGTHVSCCSVLSTHAFLLSVPLSIPCPVPSAAPFLFLFRFFFYHVVKGLVLSLSLIFTHSAYSQRLPTTSTPLPPPPPLSHPSLLSWIPWLVGALCSKFRILLVKWTHVWPRSQRFLIANQSPSIRSSQVSGRIESETIRERERKTRRRENR